jgi:dsDNA-specific endonuclease/ATPase MutS2
MLLGSSQGGGVVYVEPPAAVPANNELAAARGEAFSAEEAVLYSLTGKLMGVLPQVQEMYEVRWCSSQE